MILCVRIRFLSWFDFFRLNPLSVFIHKIVEIIEKIQNPIVTSEFIFPKMTNSSSNNLFKQEKNQNHFRQ